MVTKVISIICDLNFVKENSSFSNVLMDSFLFLIKKHNNNKTAGYNDSLHNLLTKMYKMRHDTHHMQYYIRTIKLQNI